MAFSIIDLCTYYPQVPDNPGGMVTLSCMGSNQIKYLLTSPTSSAPSSIAQHILKAGYNLGSRFVAWLVT